MKLNNYEITDLIKAAKKARRNAFVIHSSHKVGAAVLTRSGGIFEGCNVQSVISGMGICAERSAIDHAVAHGHFSIRAICIVDGKELAPCGMCLQYMLTFAQVAGKDFPVICSDTKGKYMIYSLKELLPKGYRTKHYLKRLKKYADKPEAKNGV